jgi:hypothetical protein
MEIQEILNANRDQDRHPAVRLDNAMNLNKPVAASRITQSQIGLLELSRVGHEECDRISCGNSANPKCVRGKFCSAYRE